MMVYSESSSKQQFHVYKYAGKAAAGKAEAEKRIERREPITARERGTNSARRRAQERYVMILMTLSSQGWRPSALMNYAIMCRRYKNNLGLSANGRQLI
jgi:hypothetical protein